MSQLLKFYPENPNPRHLQAILDCLSEGGVIIYPTDTVYSIGCSIEHPKAIERVAQIQRKKAEQTDFTVIFNDLSMLSDYTTPISNHVFKMLKRGTPGPFTFILEANNRVPKLFKRSKKSLGFRVPDHELPRLIVQELGLPIISSSVRDQDEVIEYTTDPELIFERFGKLVDLVVDCGIGDNNVSTVVDMTSGEPEIIRQGKGELEDLL
jgi:tRNA threonylcarbamoyl adenosine modification protein (Sua5/YciO/YrdC/YwlC family)